MSGAAVKSTLFDMSKHPWAVGDLAVAGALGDSRPDFAKPDQLVRVIHAGRVGAVPTVIVRNIDTGRTCLAHARMIKAAL